MIAQARPTSLAEESANRFLRLCLQGRRSPAGLEAGLALAGAAGFDWAAVERLAVAERLEPLLFVTLRASPGMPAALLIAWGQAYSRTARYNLLALFELARILRRLREQGVEVLVLKGAALIPSVYVDIGLRPLRDVDLLVRPDDLQSALACLADNRYGRFGLETHPGSATAYESQARLQKRTAPHTVVEIHWSLFDSPHYQARLGLDWFWETRQSLDISGAPAMAPGQGAHLLYLAGHLWLHHNGQGSLWWNDMAELVARAPDAINWDQLLGWARDYDLVLPLQQALAALARDWAAPVPARVLEQVLALKPKEAEQRVFEGMTAAGRQAGPRLWLDVVSLPSWRQRLHFAWSNLLPSPAYMRARYHIRNALLTPLYYPYRWLLGIRSALWRV